MVGTRIVGMIAAIAVAGSVCGCGPTKKKAKEERAEKGDERLAELMTERRTRLMATLPTSDDPDGSTHPWMAWVGQVAGTVSRAELKKVSVIARGTATAELADALATWLEAQKGFYFEEKLAPKEYWRDLSVASRASAGKPWQMDLDFDKIFFHAAEAARMHNLFASAPDDDRVTRFFTYWRLIWDFDAKTSLYQEEVSKLCKEKLGTFCNPMPMEQRPFQVMKPYYEAIKGMIAQFRRDHASSPYEPILTRIDAMYDKRLAAVPKWGESPELVGMRSGISAPVPGNAVLWVTDDGVRLMDNQLRKVGDAEKPWKPDWEPDAALEKDVSTLCEDVRASTVSNFNQSRILVVPQGNVAVSYLQGLIQATTIGEHAQEWRTLQLVGRRRFDGLNERVGFVVTVLAPEKVVPFKLERPGGKGGKASCTAWAVVGSQAYEAKGFAAAVFHDGKAVHVGRLAADGSFRDVQSAPPHGEGDRVEKWADGLTTAFVVAVPARATYAQLVEAMNGAALRCTAEGCRQERGTPVFVATCQP